MMKIHNYNCCGSHCNHSEGEVRTYPLGGGANLILCRDCFDFENAYRKERRRDKKVDPANFPDVPWDSAEVYQA